MDIETRIKRGEIRQWTGLAIINPYGGVWADRLFDTAEDAMLYLKIEFPRSDLKQFKLAMAVKTVEIYRDLAEPEFIPMPTDR